MFEMRRKASVHRYRRPSILKNLDGSATHVDHRFNREDHPSLQSRTLPRPPIIRHLRLFMQLPANPMADKLCYDRITSRFHMPSNCMPNVGQAITHDRLLDSKIHGLFSHSHQASNLFGRLPNRNCDRGISVESADDRSQIESDDIPFLQYSLGRDPVDDLLIHRGAKCLWIIPVAFER